MAEKHSHCSYCGHAFVPGSPWPRRCGACGHMSFRNPLPVVVGLVPVDDGLLVIRRGEPPGRGMLALPGGFVEYGESWQDALAREIREETEVIVDPAQIREARVLSAPDSTLLIFGLLGQPLTSAGLPPFTPHREVQERLVVGAPVELAFSLHTQVMSEYFRSRQAPDSVQDVAPLLAPPQPHE